MKSLAAALLVALTLPAPVDAGGCQVVTSSVVQSGSLIVTPFAVPVAVPVTVLNPSGVLFAYGSPRPTASVSQDEPPACTCGDCQVHGRAAGKQSTIASPLADHPGAAILKGRCAKCHTGGEAKGGVRLFSADEAGAAWRSGWQEHAQEVFDAVLSGEMPKGGDPLNAEEKLAIIEFLRATPAK